MNDMSKAQLATSRYELLMENTRLRKENREMREKLDVVMRNRQLISKVVELFKFWRIK